MLNIDVHLDIISRKDLVAKHLLAKFLITESVRLLLAPFFSIWVSLRKIP